MPDTGDLSFITAPDFETPTDADGNNDYEVQVTVTDGAGATDVQTLTVNVTGVNDNPPDITSDGGGATATVSVQENSTAVTNVESTDLDGETENGGGLTYSLTGGADQALFSIDPDTGDLSFINAPDFSAPIDADGNNDYEVQVTVTDGAGATDVQTLTVNVTGVNDNPPDITSDGGGANATVSVQENSTAVTNVESNDLDGETENGGGLTYSLTGGADQALFSIDPDTGDLSFIAAPDFETPTDADGNNDYDVQVTVTDGAGATDVQTLTVNVTGVNDNPPDIASDGGGVTATVSVQENSTAVTNVESNDLDGETENGGGLTYSLTGGADQALFSIDPDTGDLSFINAPDFSVPIDADGNNDYEVQVTVTDGARATDVQTLTVNVTGVNDNPPDITSDGGGITATVSVQENSTAVTNVESNDLDGETENGGGLTYSLTGGADQALFSLDPDTGDLSFINAPDFSAPIDADGNNDYEVQVTVTDGAGATDVQTLTVNVTDVNGNPPDITSDGGGLTATVSVAENTTAVTNVESTDLDGETENGGGLTYSLTGGADQALFSIDPDTGDLSFIVAPDFETPTDADGNNDYDVQVTVTDGAGATDVQTLTVNVTGVNDNPPDIASDGGGVTATVSVQENSTAVTNVESTDLDGETENGGGLTYSLTGGADQALFSIDPDTGDLSFINAPDFSRCRLMRMATTTTKSKSPLLMGLEPPMSKR